MAKDYTPVGKGYYNYNDFTVKRNFFTFSYPFVVYSGSNLLFKVKRKFSFSRGYTYELHDKNKNFLGIVIKYVKGKFFSAVFNYEIFHDNKLVGRVKFENVLRSSGSVYDSKGKEICKIQHEKSKKAYIGKKFMPFSKDKLFFMVGSKEIGNFTVNPFSIKFELHLTGKLDRLLALAAVVLIGQALGRKKTQDY